MNHSTSSDPVSLASDVHARFAAKPGNEQMASVFTVIGLVELMMNVRPRRMLEAGAGTGTLTFAALTVAATNDAPFTLITLENNDFCRDQLQANLREFEGKYTLLRTGDELPRDVEPFDLVCIDGRQLKNLPPLAHRAVVYVEGYMRDQREMLADQLAGRPFVIANYRPRNRGKGYWLLQLEPSPGERMKIGARSVYETAGRATMRVARRLVGEDRVLRLYAQLGKLTTKSR